MRKRWKLFGTAVLAAMLLTACTQADTGSPAAGTGTEAPGASGSGTVTAETSSGLTDSSGGVAETAGGAGERAAQSQPSADEAPVRETAAAETVDDQEEEAADTSAEAQTETAEPETALIEENFSDEELDAMNETESVDWNGSFTSAEDETLSIAAEDETHISFAFANAGISGEAEVDGSQAVYHGDDYHVIVFDYVEGAVEVSVLSEEDYDASGSPLNGLYTR